ncbi:MAG TPA: hypothetical protein VIK61_06655 [Acidimicrobiia bacterium]
MKNRIARLGVAAVAVALVATACTSSTKSGGGTTGGATTTAASTNDPTLNQWAITYTGGKLQKAAGAPINIGYVNDDSLFPEATIGVKAAVAYANAELNGADGHVINLKSCEVVTASDGAKCGAQMANDPSINLVLTGTLLDGNSDLYNALNGKKAVIIGNGVTPADFTNPAGHAGVALIMQPIFTKAQAQVKAVFVPNEANGTQVQSAMSAIGAGGSDVFVSILTLQSCIGMYDAIKSLGVHPTVVTTGLCFGTPMTKHLQSAGDTGAYPDGWYFGGYGYSYFLPKDTPGMQESGMNTYLAKVHQYGKPAPGATTLEYSGFAGPMFGNVLTAVKFVNELGASAATVQALDAKIRGFKGPMMLQAGPLKCNVPPYISVCGVEMGIQQYKSGHWISIADAHNNKPIVVG